MQNDENDLQYYSINHQYEQNYASFDIKETVIQSIYQFTILMVLFFGVNIVLGLKVLWVVCEMRRGRKGCERGKLYARGVIMKNVDYESYCQVAGVEEQEVKEQEDDNHNDNDNKQQKVLELFEKKKLINSYWLSVMMLIVIVTLFFISLYQFSSLNSRIKQLAFQFKYGGQQKGQFMGFLLYQQSGNLENLHSRYQQNEKLLKLLMIQDNSISTVNSYIKNWKLMLGLGWLGVRFVGVVVMAVLVGLILGNIAIQSKINKININNDDGSKKCRGLFLKATHITMNIFLNTLLFLMIFGIFMTSSLLSSVKQYNYSLKSPISSIQSLNQIYICSNHPLIGGFIVNLNKQTETKLIQLALRLQINQLEIEPFIRLCDQMQPFYQQILKIQQTLMSTLQILWIVLTLIWFIKIANNIMNNNFKIK